MQLRSAGALILSAVLTLTSSALLAQTSDSGAKRDMQSAGHETRNATVDAGHGVSHGTKKAYHKTKHGTKKAYHKTTHATTRLGHDIEGKPNTQ